MAGPFVNLFNGWGRRNGASTEKALSATGLRESLVSAPAASGVSVSPDAALFSTPVYAATKGVSEDVAKVPLGVYVRKPNGGREVAYKHPLHRIFTRRPNSWQSRFEFKEMMQVHLLLRGNAYAYIRRNGRGEVVELIPIHPNRVVILESEDGELFYQVSRSTRFEEGQLDDAPFVIPRDRILHIRGLSQNGLLGISPVVLGKEAIGLALAAEKHGAKIFSNGARVGGILKTSGRLSPEAAQRIKAQWQSAHGGLDNAFRTAVLEEGLEWQPLGMTSEDAQYLQSRTFQAEEIARMFRIPPHKIGLLNKATFSNIEHQSLEYYMDTLQPWLERWEAALERDLLTDSEAEEYFIEFDFKALLRGDFQTRMDGYTKGRQWGWFSANDIRAMEGLNPIPNGDIYLTPLNMIPAGTEQSHTARADEAQADAKIEELNARRLKAVGKKLSVVGE